MNHDRVMQDRLPEKIFGSLFVVEHSWLPTGEGFRIPEHLCKDRAKE